MAAQPDALAPPRSLWSHDTDIARSKRLALLPTCTALALGSLSWSIATVGALASNNGPFLPASIGIFVFFVFTTGAAVHGLTAYKIKHPSVDVFCILMLVPLLPLDYGLAASWVGAEAWPVALTILHGMAAAGAHRTTVCVSYAVLVLWITLRGLEEAFRMGMYSPFEDETLSRCGLPEGVSPKCAEGWQNFVVILCLRLVGIASSASFCYGLRSAIALSDKAHHSSEKLDEILNELAKFDINAAQRMVDNAPSSISPAMQQSLQTLISNLIMYRSYLPQSVLYDSAATGTARTAYMSDLHLTENPNYVSQTIKSERAPDPSRQEAYRMPPGAWDSPDTVVALEFATLPGQAEIPVEPTAQPAESPEMQKIEIDTASSCGSTWDPETSPGIQPPLENAKSADWLTKPGLLRPKYATLLLIEMTIDLEDFNGNHGVAINQFVGHVMEAAREFEGITLHIEAQRVLVSWNTHRPHPSHAAAACGCALRLDANLRESELKVQWGISVASGYFYVGSVGISQQRAPVVVGEYSQLLQGLAALNRQLRTRIIILDKTYISVRTLVEARPVDAVRAHDVPGPLVVYELLGAKDRESSNNRSTTTTLFVEAFSALQQLRLLECRAKLVSYLAIRKDDEQALRLLRLVSWLHGTPDRLAALRDTGYFRAACSLWEDHEDMSTEVPVIPADINDEEAADSQDSDAERERGVPRLHSNLSQNSLGSLGSQRRWSFRSHAGSTSGSVGRFSSKITRADSTTSRLRLQLIEAQKAQTKAAEMADEEDQPVSPTNALPVHFTDTWDREWIRSERKLGKGAFGEVWLGMSASGGLVALKAMRLPLGMCLEDDAHTAQSPASPVVSNLNGSQRSMHSGGSNRPEMARRRSRRNASRNITPRNQVKELLQEVAMLANLRHENVVGYLGSGVVGRNVMIVMEYLSGGSLHGVLHEFSKLPVTSIRRYLRDIVCGLAFLHEKEIVHRDLKPHNVLMTIDGDCKLADFGTAALLSEVTSISHNGGLTGTPVYMSPEACGGVTDKPSDIWSLGILACQLFSGKVPYQQAQEGREFVVQVFVYKLKNDKTYMPTIPEMPNDALDFVTLCLHREPSDRATAQQLHTHAFVLA